MHFLSLNACGYAAAAVANKALRVSPLHYDRGQQVAQWPQLLGCGTRSPLYVIGDATSRRGLSRVGYFILLNGQLNGHLPSYYYRRRVPGIPSSNFDENLPARFQFYSDHHQNRRLSSHSYSHESVVFFVFFGLILFKFIRRVCIF